MVHIGQTHIQSQRISVAGMWLTSVIPVNQQWGSEENKSIKILIHPKDPRTKHPGVFVFIKDIMTEKEIDYTNLSNRIVEQVLESSNLVLDEESKKKLFEDKLARARAYAQMAKQSKFLD